MDITTVVFGVVTAFTVFAIASESALVDAPGRAWATVMALGATAISLSEIIAHLRHYNQPNRQRYVIRILLMVPIYAIDSLVGFFDRAHSSTVDLARDTYEAYVIYNFFHLLLDLNGGVAETVAYWRARKPTMPHMFPLRGEMVLDKNAITLWRFFMMQYVFVSPACTLGTYVLTAGGEYDENSWSVTNGHLYLSLIRCVSVTFAFTALLYFYLATKYNIHDANPTGKFLSIKAVVFLGCWQGVAISVAESFGVFPERAVRNFLFKPEDPIHPDAAVAALENWLVIVEMFGAVLAHHFVFSYKGFPRLDGAASGAHGAHGTQTGYISPSRTGTRRVTAMRPPPSFMENLIHAFSVSDVASESKLSSKDMKERQSPTADDALARHGPQSSTAATTGSAYAKYEERARLRR
jgi:hypothetical protein